MCITCPAYAWSPSNRSDWHLLICRASCKAGRPTATPVRFVPVSRSTSTGSTMPAALAARSKSSIVAGLSTTICTPELLRASATTRAIFSVVTTGDVISTSSTPPSTITSASLTLAAQTPTAPSAICRRAMMGHLCVFVCGRSPSFRRRAWSVIWRRFASRRSRSISSAGVPSSSRLRGFARGIASESTAAPVSAAGHRPPTPLAVTAPATPAPRKARRETLPFMLAPFSAARRVTFATCRGSRAGTPSG